MVCDANGGLRTGRSPAIEDIKQILDVGLSITIDIRGADASGLLEDTNVIDVDGAIIVEIAGKSWAYVIDVVVAGIEITAKHLGGRVSTNGVVEDRWLSLIAVDAAAAA